MQASVGDRIIVRATHVGGPNRDGEIIEVRGSGGGPPYVVRWSDDGHIIGMSLPAQLAFMAIVGHRMLDRYQDLKVAFLEFGAEWIFYMVSRMDHYLPLDRGAHPFGLSMPNAS